MSVQVANEICLGSSMLQVRVSVVVSETKRQQLATTFRDTSKPLAGITLHSQTGTLSRHLWRRRAKPTLALGPADSPANRRRLSTAKVCGEASICDDVLLKTRQSCETNCVQGALQVSLCCDAQSISQNDQVERRRVCWRVCVCVCVPPVRVTLVDCEASLSRALARSLMHTHTRQHPPRSIKT